MLYNRVLITGANGLLGQALVARMSRFPEYDVLATGRDDTPRFDGYSGGYAPLDVTKPADIRALMQDFAPSVVVNCAAMTQVDRCAQERDACWATNAEAVEELAHQCRRTGARLVQVSTDFVFDGQGGPYAEDARPNPVNFYGRSKLAAENAVRGAGIDKWTIARTVLVFGTGENLGRSNIALKIADELSKGNRIDLVTDQYRTPTYVVDLAAGIERLVRFGKSGIYHLSGREIVSVYEFGQVIAETYGLDASLIHPVTSAELNQTAERPPKTGFLILKAESELGYHPRRLRPALRHLAVRLGLPAANV